jgi:WD40 repeat protein
VVTGNHALSDLKLWDARDGTFVSQLADRTATGDIPRFSPDGRWLSTGHDGGRVFSTATWKPGTRTGRTGVFSPDSQLLAVPAATGIRLVEHTTGREVAMLEDPNLYTPSTIIFHPDGTKLITLDQSRGIHVWDLTLIRAQLKSRGLDWEWPEFPEPEK